MPSPFPGMDPFLELPEFFPDLHDRFVPQVSVVLQSRLPSPYYAIIGSRVWVEQSQRPLEPDVDVLRGNEPASVEEMHGALATAVLAEPVVVTVPHDEHRDTFVDIYT